MAKLTEARKEIIKGVTSLWVEYTSENEATFCQPSSSVERCIDEELFLSHKAELEGKLSRHFDAVKQVAAQVRSDIAKQFKEQLRPICAESLEITGK